MTRAIASLPTLSSDAQSRLASLRRRIVVLALAHSGAWAIAVGLVAIIAAAWVDLAVDLSGNLRAIADVTAGALVVILALSLLIKARRASNPAALARRLDRIAGAHGQIVAGLDLTLSPSSLSTGDSPITHGLAQIAAARAAVLIQQVPSSSAAPARALGKPVSALVCIATVLLSMTVILPRLVHTEWMRFLHPMSDIPPYSDLQFHVTPGNARVIYGQTLDVRVTTLGPAAADRLDLVYVPDGQSEQIVPMFPEGDSKWRATLANLITPGNYFIRAGHARTEKFSLDILTVPEIQNVTFKITLPPYTHRAPYVGALPTGGVSGLPGTAVQITADSNRPLAGGILTLTTAAAAQSLPMTGNGNQATANFTITAPGKFSFTLTDTDGQSSADAFSGNISLLADQKPFVRIIQPPSISFATPDAVINIVTVAEDDYGISRLQIYRGLNDSQFLPQDIPVPANQPTRFPGDAVLNLNDYGLSPGDVVKLFARVQDNDPAGAKGSESKIVVIHLVSQDELDKMAMQRNAMEVLTAKYAQADRRMEALDKLAAQLQKKLEAEDPKNPMIPDERKELNDLLKQLKDAADALNKLADHQLPVDIDAALTQHIRDVADALSKGADATSAAARPGVPSGAVLDKIKALRLLLADKKTDYGQKAQAPMAHLAEILPLIADQREFVELAQHQQDLADRLSSLEAKNGNDDPDLKVRMRDLEDEQHGVRDRLQSLLDDINARADALPDDPRLDKLRATAKNFAKEAAASPADAQMQDTETALADFKGTPASLSAHDAAKTLASFIKHCNGMGNCASQSLAFQPTLADVLGNSVNQLLGEGGVGKGGGGSGGFSAYRSSLQNVGLYGSVPIMAEQSGGGGQSNGDPATADDSKPNPDQNPSDPSNSAGQHAQGASNAPVPPQYQKRVGDYFHRVEDEMSN